MIHEDIPFNFELIAADGRRMGMGRSPGLHLSDVIKYIRVVGYNDTAIDPSERLGTGGPGDFKAAMGFVFENAMERELGKYLAEAMYEPGRLITQKEYELDGIFLTPDGFDPQEQRTVETKLTWYSMNKWDEAAVRSKSGTPVVPERFETVFRWWLMQIMAGAWALGVQEAILIAAFMNGDYSHRPPRGNPQARAKRLIFTEEELEANWRKILTNAEPARKWKAELCA